MLAGAAAHIDELERGEYFLKADGHRFTRQKLGCAPLDHGRLAFFEIITPGDRREQDGVI
jgi:hypothetical protein